MKSKPLYVRFALLLFGTCILLFSLGGCGHKQRAKLRVESEPGVLVVAQDQTPRFQRMSDVGTWLGVCDGRLYVLRNNLPAAPKTDYDGWLCVIEDGELKKLVQPGNGYAILTGWVDGYLYYCRQEDGAYQLCCYDIRAGEELRLSCPEEPEPRRAAFYPGDGSMLLPMKKSDNRETPDRYIRVIGCVADQSLCDPPVLKNGAYSCGLYSDYSYMSRLVVEEKILCKAEDGRNGSEESNGTISSAIYQNQSGMLIQNRTGSDMLLLFRDGTVTPCFSVECMSSVNTALIVGDQAFLSFKRFEKLDDEWKYFATRYENDTLEGTYRICLSDGSTDKLTDEIYRDLYCFDGTSIFACDDAGNIYVLDLEGRVQRKILIVD